MNIIQSTRAAFSLRREKLPVQGVQLFSPVGGEEGDSSTAGVHVYDLFIYLDVWPAFPQPPRQQCHMGAVVCVGNPQLQSGTKKIKQPQIIIVLLSHVHTHVRTTRGGYSTETGDSRCRNRKGRG